MRWWMLWCIITAGILASTPHLEAADVGKPFDMSPERGSDAAPAATPAARPDTSPRPPPPAPVQSPAASTSPSPPAIAAVSPITQERPILPFRRLVLEGEIDSRAWNVFLTSSQATSPASLAMGYKASVMVAPESSRLQLFINDELIVDTAIAASDHVGKISVQLPAGLLKEGPNLFRLRAVQRHRTDCTIASTYELRTEIDNASTSLHFASPNAGRLMRIEDLGATSPDTNGATNLQIIVPAHGQKPLIAPVLKFAQAASILMNMPNQTVSVSSKPNTPSGVGIVTTIIGTADDLRPILPSLPQEAAGRPIVTFVDDAVLGPSTLVVSGPSVEALSQAVDAVASLVARPRTIARDVLETSRWSAPSAPLILGARRFRLSTLGVLTQEFSGRRFKTEFQVGIPSDFYAATSGEALLLLDAAYSKEVQPGSHLDVYVNGRIAATTPIVTKGGEILRHLPIRIPMTHFRPGPNRITFEAQLLTEADAQCLAGSSRGSYRFVLFDTSEFSMPNFARIAQLPNLAAFQGTAFPYNVSTDPIIVVLAAMDSDTVSAAATLFGRMAIAAGRIIRTDLNPPATSASSRNAIFVGAAPKIPTSILGQINLAESIGTTWQAPEEDIGNQANPAISKNIASPIEAMPAAALPDAVDTQETFDRWRNTLASEGGGWRGNVSYFQDWLQRTFQFSREHLRFLPTSPDAFHPPRDSTVLIAQGASISGNRAWTLLTAPTPALLRQGTKALTAAPHWFQLTGRAVSLNHKTSSLQAQPVATYAFIATQPTSFTNLRLVAANWLSEDILTFSLLLIAACLLLGLATALFLSGLGRRSLG